MKQLDKLIFLLFFLVGCSSGAGERFVTFTPEASPAPVVTPTQESLDRYFVPVSPNYELLFNSLSLERYPDSMRWYCVPMQFGFEYQFPQDRPSPQVPAWINCDVDNRNSGILTVELSDIDGSYIYRMPALPLYANRCYLAKAMGFSRVSVKPAGDIANISFTAYVEDDSGARVDLGRKPFRLYGTVEPFWVFWTEDLAPSLTVGVGVIIDFATFEGAIDIDQIHVEEVPLSYCEDVAPVS